MLHIFYLMIFYFFGFLVFGVGGGQVLIMVLVTITLCDLCVSCAIQHQNHVIFERHHTTLDAPNVSQIYSDNDTLYIYYFPLLLREKAPTLGPFNFSNVLFHPEDFYDHHHHRHHHQELPLYWSRRAKRECRKAW